MIKALLLIFDPISTWDGIVRARRSMAFVIWLYLLPLLLFTLAVEGYSMVKWGKWQSVVGRDKTFPAAEAVVVQVVQCLLSVLVVLVGAKMIKSIGETFHGQHTYDQAFTTVAYGLSPLFLLRLLDVFPGIEPWASWGIGICLSVAVLYHGVPRMMLPDPSHAFGLYLVSSALLVLVSGAVRFVTVSCLAGKFPLLETAISNLAARLPF